MPNVFTHRWKTCPPFEFELKYSMGSSLGGLGFLGALHQNINCQKHCHSTSHKERCTCSSKARRRCRGNTGWLVGGSPPFDTHKTTPLLLLPTKVGTLGCCLSILPPMLTTNHTTTEKIFMKHWTPVENNESTH